MAKAPDGNFIAAMTGQAWFKMVKVDSKTGETVPNSGRYGADYSQPEKLDATSISEFYDEAEDAGAGYLFMRNSQFQQVDVIEVLANDHSHGSRDLGKYFHSTRAMCLASRIPCMDTSRTCAPALR